MNPYDRIDELNDEITNLRAEVARLTADRERLEWFFANPVHMAYSKDGDDRRSHWAYDPRDEERGPFNQEGKFNSPREAVDAARAGGATQ